MLFLEYIRRQEGASTPRAATFGATAERECDRETVQQFRGVWDVAVPHMDTLDSTGLANLRRLGFSYADYLLGFGGDYATARTVIEIGLKDFGQGPRGWIWKRRYAKALEELGEYVDAARIAEAVVKELEARDAAGVQQRQWKHPTWLGCFRWRDSPPAADVDIKCDATDLGDLGDLANASVDLADAWHAQASIYGRHLW